MINRINPIWDKYQDMSIFNNVSMEALERQLENCNELTLSRGKILLEPTNKNKNLFVILSGSLAVHLESLESEPLLVLTKGDCVGELSILSQVEVSAFVVVEEPCRLLQIDHETLWSMINSSHALARNLLFILSRRIRNDNSRLVGYMKSQAHFKRYATLDALTGLYNRYWLNNALPRQIERAKKNLEPLSLLMIDVDFFKKFNDQYGHLAGDTALTTLSQAFNQHLRPADHAARFGGEEFIVILMGINSDEASCVAERLRKHIEKMPIEYEDQILNITISVGISGLAAGQNMNDLLKLTDQALYKAKDRGRNRCVLE